MPPRQASIAVVRRHTARVSRSSYAGGDHTKPQRNSRIRSRPSHPRGESDRIGASHKQRRRLASEVHLHYNFAREIAGDL